MKKTKIIAFAIGCILIVLFVLIGYIVMIKVQNKGVSVSNNEAYSEILRLKYEKNNKEAYAMIAENEDSNDKYFQYLIGDFYYYGYGVKADYEKAFKYYKKSAEQGYDKAQNMVGYLYEKGYGVEKNNIEALNWYKKSAEQDNIYALQRTCLAIYLWKRRS